MSGAEPMAGRKSERGAALLTVLLLVAVMAVIASMMLGRLSLATSLAANGQSLSQARLYSAAAENLAISQIQTLVEADPARTTNATGWVGREFSLPFENGGATGRVTDGGNCFNLNSVVTGEKGNYTARNTGIQQFRTLMIALDIPAGQADIVAGSLADWIDSDQSAQREGAEDGYYASLDTPYLTADQLVADVTELRAVRGVTPEIYTVLRPWICALPMAELSPINVNTLTPDQAILLHMLAPESIDRRRAVDVIAARPADGYSGTVEFWQKMAANPSVIPQAVTTQTQVRTRWFLLDMTIRIGDTELIERALIDGSLTPARLAHRQWGEDL